MKETGMDDWFIESSCNSTTIGIDLSNHGLLQLYNR
jgi:hypothetical protein